MLQLDDSRQALCLDAELTSVMPVLQILLQSWKACHSPVLQQQHQLRHQVAALALMPCTPAARPHKRRQRLSAEVWMH
jgi:hypothetical protein